MSGYIGSSLIENQFNLVFLEWLKYYVIASSAKENITTYIPRTRYGNDRQKRLVFSIWQKVDSDGAAVRSSGGPFQAWWPATGKARLLIVESLKGGTTVLANRDHLPVRPEYGIDAIALRSSDFKYLDSTVNRFFMKLFKPSSLSTIAESQLKLVKLRSISFWLPSVGLPEHTGVTSEASDGKMS